MPYDINYYLVDVEQTGGGDSPECYELVLKQVRENISWSENSKRVFVLIGKKNQSLYPFFFQVFNTV